VDGCLTPWGLPCSPASELRRAGAAEQTLSHRIWERYRRGTSGPAYPIRTRGLYASFNTVSVPSLPLGGWRRIGGRKWWRLVIRAWFAPIGRVAAGLAVALAVLLSHDENSCVRQRGSTSSFVFVPRSFCAGLAVFAPCVLLDVLASREGDIEHPRLRAACAGIT